MALRAAPRSTAGIRNPCGNQRRRCGRAIEAESEPPGQSGGTKVVLARWLAERPRVLLLDEPFQGVDVGARADIAAAVRAQSDVATVIATSDAEEALEVADRILVLDAEGLRPLQTTEKVLA